jgi:hypothetical protein
VFRQPVKDRVAEAMKGRAEIQAAPDDTARAIQEQRHRSLEARLTDIRLMGDAVIVAFFAEDKPKARENKRAEVESWLGGSPVAWDKLAATTATLKHGARGLFQGNRGGRRKDAHAAAVGDRGSGSAACSTSRAAGGTSGVSFRAPKPPTRLPALLRSVPSVIIGDWPSRMCIRT